LDFDVNFELQVIAGIPFLMSITGDILGDEKITEQRIALIRKIKKERIKKGISTSGMADMIDMREPNYVRAESGRQSIGIDMFLKIVNALGLEIEIIDKS
jgi:DNA-binding XRE family transcriptional regulator